MAYQQRLVETLVSLADTLVADYDVIEFMQTLAERSVELVGVSAAGIMLADAEGRLHHAACSSEQMRLVELLELQLEEGPCFDAFRSGSAVRSETPDDAAARWPHFAPHAREGGFVAVSAVPLRLRQESVGSAEPLLRHRGRTRRHRPRHRAGDGRHRHHRHRASPPDRRPRSRDPAARGCTPVPRRDRAGEGRRRRAHRRRRRRGVRADPAACPQHQPAPGRRRPRRGGRVADRRAGRRGRCCRGGRSGG